MEIKLKSFLSLYARGFSYGYPALGQIEPRRNGRLIRGFYDDILTSPTNDRSAEEFIPPLVVTKWRHQ